MGVNYFTFGFWDYDNRKWKSKKLELYVDSLRDRQIHPLELLPINPHARATVYRRYMKDGWLFFYNTGGALWAINEGYLIRALLANILNYGQIASTIEVYEPKIETAYTTS